MEQIKGFAEIRNKRQRRVANGRIYFSRAAERKFFFALTVIMLLLGALYRLGVLQ